MKGKVEIAAGMLINEMKRKEKGTKFNKVFSFFWLSVEKFVANFVCDFFPYLDLFRILLLPPPFLHTGYFLSGNFFSFHSSLNILFYFTE